MRARDGLREAAQAAFDKTMDHVEPWASGPVLAKHGALFMENLRAALAAATPAGTISEQVDAIEAAVHPEGRCVDCGGGKPYWRHEKHDANREGHHPFRATPEQPQEDGDLDVERLAAIEHDQWIEWARSVMDSEPISEARRERWPRYMVPYAELDEATKEHDRKWARKVAALRATPEPPEECEHRAWYVKDGMTRCEDCRRWRDEIMFEGGYRGEGEFRATPEPPDLSAASACGCSCKCHADEAKAEWPGPCAGCCEPGDNCDCGRALARVMGPLDEAWREAEAALPKGWFIESVRRDWHHEPPRWWVRRFRPIRNQNTETKDGPDAATPAAALRALAARLRESTP